MTEPLVFVQEVGSLPSLKNLGPHARFIDRFVVDLEGPRIKKAFLTTSEEIGNASIFENLRAN